jgi:hypothetical protein
LGTELVKNLADDSSTSLLRRMHHRVAEEWQIVELLAITVAKL